MQVSTQIPKSNIALLCDHGDQNKVIGFEIWRISTIKTDRIIIHPSLDMVEYVEKDSPRFTTHITGSNVAVLYTDRHPHKVIGVQLWNISKIEGETILLTG